MTPEDFQNIPTAPGPLGDIRQVAYIVDDIDAAINHWQKTHNVGPFLINRNITPLQNSFYRGKKMAKAPINIAFAYINDVQLELIQSLHDTPSIYNEAAERKITGVHHYAVCVDDFNSAYQWVRNNNFESVLDTGIDGLVRMSYVENRDTALTIEVVEWNALTQPIFTDIQNKWAAIEDRSSVVEFDLQALTPKSAVLKALGKFLVKKLMGKVESTMPG